MKNNSPKRGDRWRRLYQQSIEKTREKKKTNKQINRERTV